MQIIIFTDLDGSLLDHGNYSFAEAIPSLNEIKRSGIPLIMTTSKTRSEVERLQREIGVRQPMIVENGGGIYFPRGYRNWKIGRDEAIGDYTVIRMGDSYSRIRDFLKKMGAHFNIRGFGDMEPLEIASLTGLPIENAALAKEREFTEPFILPQPDDIRLLSDMVEADGFKVTRGGRFHHLMARGQDKGKAVRMVCDIFRQHYGTALTTVGLGDSENDLGMLEQVDIPVLIPRPEKGYLDVRLPGLIRAGETGAAGWNDTVQKLLNERMKSGTKEQ